jgi:hypothetical protein
VLPLRKPVGRLAALAALVAFAVYLLTLAPGLTWHNDGADGGDLITAVVTGGVPHPSGYPTYLMLGELFVRLPIGDFAYRLNVLSAAAAAGAVGLTMLAAAKSLECFNARRPGVVEISAAVAALTFAFSSILWSQAVIAEVYALNALFSALVWYLMVSARAGGRWWQWLLAAGALGIGLGNHLSLVALAPAFGLLIAVGWRRGGAVRGVAGAGFAADDVEGASGGAPWSSSAIAIRVAGVVLAFFIGLGVYIALPLRAAHGAPVNWGGANTMDGFVWLVTGQAYAPLVVALPLAHVPARLLAAAALLVRQAAWWGVPVAYFGIRSMWHRDRPLAVATLVSAGLTAIYAVGYNTSDSFVYLIPIALVIALWIAWGLREVLDALDGLLARLTSVRRRLARWAAGCGVAVLIALPLVVNLRVVDASGDRSAHDYGTRALESAAAEALIVGDAATDTFPLWYFRYAEGRRPDVAVVNGHLLAYDWYRASVARWHPEVEVPDDAFTEGFIEANLDRRPVYVTTTTTWRIPDIYRLVADGLLYRIELR